MKVAWKQEGESIRSPFSTVLIHGFGACKEHWRHNQQSLGEITTCYAIDLIGFGESSQPNASLKEEAKNQNNFCYCFDNWSQQVTDFCKEVVKGPVLLIGNSIGGVIALKTSQLLKSNCKGVILIDCAQRTMDDKRLAEQTMLQQNLRPFLKVLVSKRWFSENIFHFVSQEFFIKQILKVAYPSGNNLDKSLVDMLIKPTKRRGAPEAFRGFINLFDDYLAPELMKDLDIPIDLIWGENDPWEPLSEAEKWILSMSNIRSLKVVKESGHCPHDEHPEVVNPLLRKIIQQAK